MEVATQIPEEESAENPDSIRRLLDSLRTDLGLGLSDYLRVEKARILMAARGIDPRSEAAIHWLTPLLATSPQEQTLVRERFLQHLPPEIAGAISTTVAPAVAQGSARPRTDRPRKIDGRRFALIGGAVVVLAFVAWLAFHIPPPHPTLSAAPQTDETVVLPHAVAPPLRRLNLASINRPLALLPLLLAGGAVWLRRRRRLAISRALAPAPSRTERVWLSQATAPLYDDPLLERALASLRRHRVVPGGRLNVRRTLRATLRNAGQPVLRFGARPQTPEYLLLTERESPRDHFPLAADLLVRHMEAERVIVSRYDFYGDPRRLQPAAEAVSRPAMRLGDVLALHLDARVVVLAEAEIFFDKAGRLQAWVGDLGGSGHVVLLTPRRAADWDWRERELEGAGVLVLPATTQGVMGYADRLRGGGEDGLARWSTQADPRIDLPLKLAAHHRAITGEDPLAERDLDALLGDLRAWLGEDGHVLLRALAVFPRIEPNLTIHLGAALAGPTGTPLLTEDILLALARLPWLRVGRFPDWLRRGLIAGMMPEQLDTVLRALQAYLRPNEVVEGQGPSLDIARRSLRDWIRRDSTADLDDRIFIDALSGRRPQDLAVEAPPSLRDWARSAFGGGDWIWWFAGAAAAVAVAVAHRPIVAWITLALPPSMASARADFNLIWLAVVVSLALVILVIASQWRRCRVVAWIVLWPALVLGAPWVLWFAASSWVDWLLGMLPLVAFGLLWALGDGPSLPATTLARFLRLGPPLRVLGWLGFLAVNLSAVRLSALAPDNMGFGLALAVPPLAAFIAARTALGWRQAGSVRAAVVIACFTAVCQLWVTVAAGSGFYLAAPSLLVLVMAAVVATGAPLRFAVRPQPMGSFLLLLGSIAGGSAAGIWLAARFADGRGGGLLGSLWGFALPMLAIALVSSTRPVRPTTWRSAALIMVALPLLGVPSALDGDRGEPWILIPAIIGAVLLLAGFQHRLPSGAAAPAFSDVLRQWRPWALVPLLWIGGVDLAAGFHPLIILVAFYLGLRHPSQALPVLIVGAASSIVHLSREPFAGSLGWFLTGMLAAHLVARRERWAAVFEIRRISPLAVAALVFGLGVSVDWGFFSVSWWPAPLLVLFMTVIGASSARRTWFAVGLVVLGVLAMAANGLLSPALARPAGPQPNSLLSSLDAALTLSDPTTILAALGALALGARLRRIAYGADGRDPKVWPVLAMAPGAGLLMIGAFTASRINLTGVIFDQVGLGAFGYFPAPGLVLCTAVFSLWCALTGGWRAVATLILGLIAVFSVHAIYNLSSPFRLLSSAIGILSTAAAAAYVGIRLQQGRPLFSVKRRGGDAPPSRQRSESVMSEAA